MKKRPIRQSIPEFTSEAEEREFWETHDSSPFFDWTRARLAVFPNLKPSTETISLRLPAALLSELKQLANKRDVPYQSLLKVFLAERVARETTSGSTLPRSTVHRTRGGKSRSGKTKTSRAARG